MKRILYVAGLMAVVPGTALAQSVHPHCGYDLVAEKMRLTVPGFDQKLEATQRMTVERVAALQQSNPQARTTGGPYQVKVIFHIVLDTAKIQQLGGAAGIQTRVQSQLQALNADFNAENPDSVKIPAPFKPLYGNMNIRFVAADKKPDGSTHPTPGYEIKYTTKPGFDVMSGTTGSTYACSDAKYATSGGLAAWDPDKYYNIWIVNITPLGVGGVATPPPHPPFNIFPTAEQGAVITYGAFGKRTSPGQYFLTPGAEAGRTLVHETGHFFNLFHIWGSTADCSDDDGITDTPPQADLTPQNCPAFPKLDACSPSGNGVMFMNHMDYSCDTCRTMFSKGQVAQSQAELVPGGLRYTLVSGNATAAGQLSIRDNDVLLYPNPAARTTTLSFRTATLPRSVQVRNSVGQVVADLPVDGRKELTIDVSSFSKGIYLVQSHFFEGTLTHKLVVCY